MDEDFSQLLAREEAKRYRHLSPQQQQEFAQQLLNRAESQRNTKEACLREQEKLLAGLEASR